jgi:hypothetical protein
MEPGQTTRKTGEGENGIAGDLSISTVTAGCWLGITVVDPLLAQALACAFFLCASSVRHPATGDAIRKG